MKKVIIIILLAIGSLSVKAQIPQPDPDTTTKHFLIVASIGNLQEISASQLAVQKAKRADVKSFGQMMVMDHQKSQNALSQLAKKKGYHLPAEATGGIQQDLNLKKATNAFERMYVHAMAVNHANTVETFENYATTGKDPDVKAFAKQMLPTLKQHLTQITAIDKQIKDIAK